MFLKRQYSKVRVEAGGAPLPVSHHNLRFNPIEGRPGSRDLSWNWPGSAMPGRSQWGVACGLKGLTRAPLHSWYWQNRILVISSKTWAWTWIFLVGRVAPSVIPANGTRPALTKGEVTVGGCSGGKIPSPPHVPKGREAVVSAHH